MDRGTRRATAHRVARSWTRLKQLSLQALQEYLPESWMITATDYLPNMPILKPGHTVILIKPLQSSDSGNEKRRTELSCSSLDTDSSFIMTSLRS